MFTNAIIMSRVQQTRTRTCQQSQLDKNILRHDIQLNAKPILTSVT